MLGHKYISQSYFIMTENREWTEYEDKILKLIRDGHKVQKWSTIAQNMAQQFGLKGRNGKQCKQRYMEVFDQNNQVLHWDYQTEQLMFLLHDNFGNKWAAIGQQLHNRTDNDVKNHFYSKIRKGLRKINYIVKDHFRKEFKQIKQTIICKIIQGTEDIFSTNPIHQQDVWNFCQQAKNTLLRMSYDEDKYNPWNNFINHQLEIKGFIENLAFFSKEFKRKPRVLKKNDGQQQTQKMQSLHTHLKIPIVLQSNQWANSVCDSEISSSQIQESHSRSDQMQKMQVNLFKSGFLPPQSTSFEFAPALTKKAQKINPVIILKSSNQLSEMADEKTGTRLSDLASQKQQRSLQNCHLLLPCIPKLKHTSSKIFNAMIDEDQEDQQGWIQVQNSKQNNIEHELMKQGLLEEDDGKICPGFSLFNGNNSKNITSKGSNFSSYSIDQEEELHFFDQDITLNMRIFTTGVGGKMTKTLQQSIQKSEKLFKSLERGEQLFQSLGSQGKRDLEMSIQKSGDLRQFNSLFQSVGR